MDFKCKNMEGCPMYDYLTTSVRIIQLQPFLNEYCLNSNNYNRCARYKIIEGLRVLVWVISYLFEHTGKDFQSQVLLVA